MRILLTAYVRFANALAWQCQELAEGLIAAGHEVFVLVQSDSLLATRLFERKIPHDASSNLNRATLSEILRARKLVRNTLLHFQPDVLNPHCPPGHLYLSLFRKRYFPEATFIRTVGEPRPPKRNFVNRWLHETIADGIIVSCKASQQRYLDAFHLLPEKVLIIYPGFESEAFAQYTSHSNFRQRYGIKDDELLLGIVARLSPEKGHRVLLEAFARISSDFPKMKLMITGPNASEQTAQDLANYAQSLGIADKIVFTGKVDDVREVMAELCIGVIPSLRSEAICRVALEYMAWGIPIIASDVNILPDVVRDGINGWIAPVGDAARLATALGDALTNETERIKRGVRGKSFVSAEFSRIRMVEQTLAFYQEARKNEK